jgi:hypothetical protein
MYIYMLYVYVVCLIAVWKRVDGVWDRGLELGTGVVEGGETGLNMHGWMGGRGGFWTLELEREMSILRERKVTYIYIYILEVASIAK